MSGLNNRIKFIAIIISLLGLFPFAVNAQVRGPGVGALAGTTNGTTTVTIFSGRTAPWAEVIVETNGDELQAVAEIDATGLFTFSFNTQAANIGNLKIYAVDEAGVTASVLVNGTGLSNFILPPTIIVNTVSLPDTSIGLRGYSYPGATLTITMTSTSGYSESFTSDAHGTSGKWSLQEDDLAPGDYSAYAVAFIGSLTSGQSQDLTFTILGPTPTPTPAGIIQVIGDLPGAQELINMVSTVIDSVSDAFSNAERAVVRLVSDLPASAKANSSLFSKALAPIAAVTILWTSGLLNLLTSFDYLTTGARILLGFFIPMRRKKNRWGVVYDGVTKNPIARSIVRLYRGSGELVETEVTGKTGIFSFLTEEGQYEVNAMHPEYIFPSRLVTGVEDGEYQSVYHGDIFRITRDNPVVNLSIPLDPKGYNDVIPYNVFKDWLRKFTFWGNASLYILGLSLSVISYFANPVLYNQLVIVFYIFSIAYLVHKIYDNRTRWSTVVDLSGKPASGVALSLLDSVFRRLVQRRVADTYGRFQFIVPAGGYIMLVSSPEYELASIPDGYHGGTLEVKTSIGVLKTKVYVKKKEVWNFNRT